MCPVNNNVGCFHQFTMFLVIEYLLYLLSRKTVNSSSFELSSMKGVLEQKEIEKNKLLSRQQELELKLLKVQSELSTAHGVNEATQSQLESDGRTFQKTSEALSMAECRVIDLEGQADDCKSELAALRASLAQVSSDASAFDQTAQQHLSVVSRMEDVEKSLRQELAASQSRGNALETQLMVLKGTFDAEREAAASSAAALRLELDALVNEKTRDIEASYQVSNKFKHSLEHCN